MFLVSKYTNKLETPQRHCCSSIDWSLESIITSIQFNESLKPLEDVKQTKLASSILCTFTTLLFFCCFWLQRFPVLPLIHVFKIVHFCCQHVLMVQCIESKLCVVACFRRIATQHRTGTNTYRRDLTASKTMTESGVS